MARKKEYQDLYVYMNSVLVGKLISEPTGQLVFTYDLEWLNWKNARPISLSMPLTEVPYKGSIVECFFDNLLPDSDIIRERIQIRFQAPSKKCFDLLSHIGRDCVGALQLLTSPTPTTIKNVQANPINDHEIATLLQHYQTAPLGMEKGNDFRISIAGAQEKTALLWHKNQWNLPQGVTPTSHIIKLPIGIIKHSGLDLSGSVENEWLCLQILSVFDLPVNHAEMIKFDDIKTLVIQRFDRQWDVENIWLMRLPQEDLCQTLGIPPGLKYESDGGPGIKDIMQILLGSEQAHSDRIQFMKSVFLFWVLGAIDGHAKNFSLKIAAEGRYRLTPLYDVISAYPLADNHPIEWQKLKMAMCLKSKSTHYAWDRIQLRHWLTMAEKCQFSPMLMQTIIDEILDNMESVITRVSNHLPNGFPNAIADSVFSGMRTIKRKSCKS